MRQCGCTGRFTFDHFGRSRSLPHKRKVLQSKGQRTLLFVCCGRGSCAETHIATHPQIHYTFGVEYPFPPVGIVGAADGKNRRAFLCVLVLRIRRIKARAATEGRPNSCCLPGAFRWSCLIDYNCRAALRGRPGFCIRRELQSPDIALAACTSDGMRPSKKRFS
jgi:hypothetical protein